MHWPKEHPSSLCCCCWKGREGRGEPLGLPCAGRAAAMQRACGFVHLQLGKRWRHVQIKWESRLFLFSQRFAALCGRRRAGEWSGLACPHLCLQPEYRAGLKASLVVRAQSREGRGLETGAGEGRRSKGGDGIQRVGGNGGIGKRRGGKLGRKMLRALRFVCLWRGSAWRASATNLTDMQWGVRWETVACNGDRGLMPGRG